ncbi:MAG: hypothetical protein KKB51_02545 [Candidatus Riflebacteria bacterium]|nr:hypothetical protein [Candidatus Riflebacteria bacterium]
MKSIPAHNYENEIPLSHDFVCTGFLERIANWTRFLCFGFLLLQLLAIVINLVSPFAIAPPQPFYQLLFFLLACAAFEIFAIPIEAIKDHCVIDLQKMMVVKIYYRYFHTKVEVLATFGDIKTVGVSARPAPILKSMFSESIKRYSLVILTENNKFFRLTDFNLSLEEANQIAKNLHESSLRQAGIVYGSENMELCLDPQGTDSLVAQPCHRSALTLIDAAFIPAFEAMSGVLLVAIFISLIAITGDSLSDKLFNTNLKIANQPIFQILLAMGRPDPDISILTPPDGPPPVLPIRKESLAHNPSEKQAPDTSDQISNLAVTVPATATTPETLPPVLDDPMSVTVITSSTVTEQTTQEASCEVSAVVEPSPDFTNTVVTQDENSVPVQTENSIPEPEPKPEPKTISEPKPEPKRQFKPESKPEPNPVPAMAVINMPVLMPLPSRIPSFNETAVLAAIADENKEVMQPVKVIVPAQPKAPNQPVQSVKKHAKLKPPHVALSSIPATTSLKPGTLVTDYIGQSVKEALNSLGQPLARVTSTNGQQLIYSGITLLTDSTGDKVTQVNLTSNQSKLFGTLATSEGLSVGKLVREAKARLGIPQTKEGSAGLHFPARGISIYPLPGNPETIGSIQLYQSKSQ